MPRGGARQGAGRPRGKTNAPSMQTLKTQIADLQAKAKARAEADADGNLLPLPYFLNILNDPEADEGMRFAAAKEAAPYLHPRLQATMLKDMTGTLTHEQRLAELDAACSAPKTIDHDTPQHGNGADELAATEGPGAGLASVAGLADDADQVD